ncbi:MAG TPA: response regulator [Candidatus Obscuribacterales bacterium]
MKKKLILVVEDDPVVRELTKRQLKLLGFDSVAVGSGEEAVEKAQGGFALIFMDIGLPGINGEHATLLIREKELYQQRKRTPIVALTAHSDRERCKFAGMDDYLQKPALLQDIRGILEKWVQPENGDNGC